MMTEAEVSLRVAYYYLENNLVNSDVQVAIDGAQIKTANMIHFDIANFLKDQGWIQNAGMQGWQGTYSKVGINNKLVIHSNPGMGDVIANLNNGNILRVESKKGTLTRSISSAEYRLLREAIGQLMTIDKISDKDIFAVAVPKSDKMVQLITRWMNYPLILKVGINFITVERNGIITKYP